eukprot:TRINITY_DN6074_c0_g1_i1.p1 TRINITY_DN6074_c0_g1~~TRINITY_DN6074_c0_g1_i1.p1  ORF type:complete len:949 (-),score=113.70 TRINITY_DN6074_c0_g1_i1:185-2626(-)
MDKIKQLWNGAPAIPSLFIPAYNWLNDDEHGMKVNHGTALPSGNCLGATWSKPTLRAIGDVIGVEARGDHNGYVHEGTRGVTPYYNGVGITAYAPNLNLVRDPRWGRAQEVLSEDPLLTSLLTIEYVKGVQGNSSDYMQAAACCKHYAAYDLESIPTVRYKFDAQVNARNMWETYMPAFHACVVEAQGAHVMCSYNAINGVPTCGDKGLMNGVLRSQWKWPGFVISDYDAWSNIYLTHNYTQNLTAAAAVGINAGLDQEGGDNATIMLLPTALSLGTVNASTIDTSFRRLFRVRIQLGMLDPPTFNPYNYITNTSQFIESTGHLNIALTSARQGMCLYQNNNDALPLMFGNMTGNAEKMKSAKPSMNVGGTVLLVGPQSVQTQLLIGNYGAPHGPDEGIVSILQGVSRQLGGNQNATCQPEWNIDYESGPEASAAASPEICCNLCTYTPGCMHYVWRPANEYEPIHQPSYGQCSLKYNSTGRHVTTNYTTIAGNATQNLWAAGGQVMYEPGCHNVACDATDGFQAAIDAVAGLKNGDAVVVVLGLDQNIESEGHDRSNLSLPMNQYALVSQLRQQIQQSGLDIPLVGVLVHGGTIEMQSLSTDLDAVVDAWYPGQLGGHAVSDVLFGNYNPAGRASVTYYQSTDQLGPMGQMDLYAGNGTTYRYFNGAPQYPFGRGLSYTTFNYSSMSVNSTVVDPCSSIGVSVVVTNTGLWDGDEVVQVYVQQPQATVPVPNIRLVDFERVHINAGETVTVHLTITPSFHSVVYNSTDVFKPTIAVEKGPLYIYAGPGQPQFNPNSLHTAVQISNTTALSEC